MILWNEVEDIDERHGIPADGTAPEFLREAGLRIRPLLLVTLVPAVIQQSGFRIARVLFHPDELIHDVVEHGRLFEGGRVLSHERLRHVEAIEPHLPWVALLVPETALLGARVVLHLRAQQLFLLDSL